MTVTYERRLVKNLGGPFSASRRVAPKTRYTWNRRDAPNSLVRRVAAQTPYLSIHCPGLNEPRLHVAEFADKEQKSRIPKTAINTG